MRMHVVGIFFAVVFGVLAVAVPPSFADKASPGRPTARLARESGDVSAAGAAWTAGPDAAVVKVPFMFAVDGRAFPAGTYAVSREEDDPGVLLIADADGHHAALVGTMWGNSLNAHGRTVFTFRVYNGDRFLSAVAMPDDVVQKIPLSRKTLIGDAEAMAVARCEIGRRG